MKTQFLRSILVPCAAFALAFILTYDISAQAAKTTRPAAGATRTLKATGTPPLVSVTGRVETFSGKPIRNAAIMLMNIKGGAIFTASGSMGYYGFYGVVPGQTYILGVFHGRFLFASPTQVIDVNADQSIILVGEENMLF